MWKVTQHKEPKGKQDLLVKMIVKDLAEYSQSTYAESFMYYFKIRLKYIKRSNNYSADLTYTTIQRNHIRVEVWKLKVNGDFKDKMFTLDYVGS